MGREILFTGPIAHYHIPFASVHNGHACTSACPQKLLGGRNRSLHCFQIPALNLAESLFQQKVALHVDNEESSVLERKGECVWFCINGENVSAILEGGHGGFNGSDFDKK
jgi:hypothetical protein